MNFLLKKLIQGVLCQMIFYDLNLSFKFFFRLIVFGEDMADLNDTIFNRCIRLLSKSGVKKAEILNKI